MANYTSIPFNFVGGENKTRSKHWSSESSVNLYVDRQSSGRTEFALMSWPGEKAFSTGSAGISRGMHVTSKGDVYVVNGNDFYQIGLNGDQTRIGSIGGIGRCSFADDGANILVRETGSIAYINSQFVITGPGTTYMYDGTTYSSVGVPLLTASQWAVSDAGDPSTWLSTNAATSEAIGDDLKQVFVHQQKMYLAGSGSIQPFYDSTTGSPSFTRIEQGVINTLGVASSWTMAATNTYIYFLGNDNVVYRINTFQPQSITPTGISQEISKVSTSNAFGFTCCLHGSNFYILQFPDDDLTLAFSEKTNEWNRLSTGTSLANHLLRGYAYANKKHLVLNNDSSDVYEWDFDTYQSNGSIIIRQRDSAPINGLTINAPGSRLLMNKATIVMETGVGSLISENPLIMVSASYDGGRTFENEDWIEIGREGESVKRVDWYNMASFYDIVIRVRVSDPNFISIHGGVISLKKHGI